MRASIGAQPAISLFRYFEIPLVADFSKRQAHGHQRSLGALALDVDLATALRFGTTPDGRQLDPAFMPWPATGQLSDLQLGAIYLYLRTLPGLETGSG